MSRRLAPAKYETVADLIDDLGDIPPWRIRMHPMPGKATVGDVVALDDHGDRLFELVDGTLVEKGMGFLESRIATLLSRLLDEHAEAHDLGIVAGADGMMRLGILLVRIPDVSFVSWERLPGGEVPRDPVPELAPDLAVEVLSASNTRREMERKTREYFEAGGRLVWIVDPVGRRADVRYPTGRSASVDEAGFLDGEDVLPGFRIRLGELLDRAEQRPSRRKKP